MFPNRSKGHEVVCIFLCAVLVVVTTPRTGSITASEPPEEQVFYWQEAISEEGPEENRYHVSVYPPRPTEEEWRAVLTLNPTPARSSWLSYELHLDDVVPMLGRLYRVVKFDPGGDNSVTLREFDPDQLPCWVRLNPKNLAITPNGGVTISARQFNADTIAVVVQGIALERTKMAPVAQVLVESRGSDVITKKYSNVRVGDILKANGAGMIVRSIVPPIPKHNVVGWVEFDPTPVKLDENGDATLEPQDPNDEPQRRRIRNPRRLFRRSN